MVTILIVEDDDAIAEAVAYGLARAGHEVVRAADGVEALRELRSRPFDLALLDLMLPRISGQEVLRALRAASAVPVIIVSARDADAEQVEALDDGADDYITKPFSMRQLLARVAAVLRRATPPDRKSTRLNSSH